MTGLAALLRSPRRALCLGAAATLWLAAAPPAPAEGVVAGALTITGPTAARPALPNRPVAVYLEIANAGPGPDRLIAARAPDFEAVEIHEATRHGEAIGMRRVEALEIPAGDTAALAPGERHLMLFGAARALADGDTFPLILVFEQAGEVAVEVVVKKHTRGDAGHQGHSGN